VGMVVVDVSAVIPTTPTGSSEVTTCVSPFPVVYNDNNDVSGGGDHRPIRLERPSAGAVKNDVLA